MTDAKPAKLSDPLAFICLRNYDAFQYTEAGRPRKSGDRRRWARLHLALLTSRDWTAADANTKVAMVTLIVLATQYQNRVPNDHAYISHVTGLSIEETDAAMRALHGAGNRGFFELTLDATPDEEPTVTKAKPRPKGKSLRFDDFWKVYPKRKDRKAALARWITDGLDACADVIIAAVIEQAKQPDWQKDNGQFIPYAATWLNKERWKDEATTTVRRLDELPDLDPERRF